MPDDPSDRPRFPTGFSKDAFHGTRGLVIAACFSIVLFAANCLTWIGAPDFLGENRFGKPTPIPPSHLPYLWISTVAVCAAIPAMLIASFLGIWTHLSTPPKTARSHTRLIAVIVALGIALALLHACINMGHS